MELHESAIPLYSSIAQSVEHAAVNRGVVGSSPTGGAKARVSVKLTGFFICPNLLKKTASGCFSAGGFLFVENVSFSAHKLLGTAAKLPLKLLEKVGVVVETRIAGRPAVTGKPSRSMLRATTRRFLMMNWYRVSPVYSLNLWLK